MASNDRLVVVANRMPVHRVTENGRSRWETSPGGLVSAVAPFIQKCEGSWIGWPGVPGEVPEPFTHDDIHIRAVGMSASELNSYYYGCCNATIWPLYHDAIRTPVFRRSWWRSYEQLNRRFAERTAEVVDNGDLVWVHDYQLQLVPTYLRELKPNLKIGFFLHIPFPPEEIFARLPWRSHIIEGLLGADVLGFQTQLGAQNFSRAARRFTEARGSDYWLQYEDRTVRVAAYPISIDVKRYQQLADSQEVIDRSIQLREQLGLERKFLLGVDRMDYTKGIDTRLRAYQDMLRRGRFSVRDCVLNQIAVPSRERVEEYERLRSAVEELVGRVNGDFAEPGLAAIHYLRRNLPMKDLVAFYLAADVMIVTPLRDGMNLVAKEYVATRTADTGVLILSEFAGAAREMRSALMVNPYDIDGMAGSFETAMEMSDREIKRRMRALRRSLAKNDVFNWADSFIAELRQ